jgi:hypothetical protein
MLITTSWYLDKKDRWLIFNFSIIIGAIKIEPKTTTKNGIRYKRALFFRLRYFLKKIKLKILKASSPVVDIAVSIVIKKIAYLLKVRVLLIKLKITAKLTKS